MTSTKSLCLPFLISFLLFVGESQAQTPTWQRVVAPWSVLDEAGTPLDIPFVGGSLEPKVRLANLVGDERPDLVVSVGGASLELFERTDEGYAWRTDRLSGVEPRNWFALGDLDGNGNVDLLTYGGNGQVMFFKNQGRDDEGLPVFELVDDTLKTPGGDPLYVEDNTFPALVDIDGDGDLDLMTGTSSRGNITFYRNEGLSTEKTPLFSEVTRTFDDIEIYEPNPSCRDASFGGKGTMHGSNALAFADLTGDGAPELLWGDFFSPSLYFFQNGGTATEPQFEEITDQFPPDEPLTTGGYNAPTLADADGDGDQDLVVGILGGLCATRQSWIDNILYFENEGSAQEARFSLETERLIQGIDVGRRSTPAVVDLNGDGLLDLVLGNETDIRDGEQATLALFLNEGTSEEPIFRLVDGDWLGLEYDFGGYAPAFADIDDDGDLDLFVGGFNGRIAFLRNTGSATESSFELEDEAFFDIDGGQYARLTFGDIDADGNLDLLVGGSNGRLNLYRNQGSSQSPVFEAAERGLATEADTAYASSIGLPKDIGDGAAPQLVDLDGDGDLDLLVGTAWEGIVVFENTGGPESPFFEQRDTIPVSRRRVTPVAADLTGDGALELLAGSDAGGVLLWIVP